MTDRFPEPICVTRPFLPSREAFCDGLKEIWDRQWVTNNGPVLERFHRTLVRYFSNEHISLLNNGTLALQIGLQALGLAGEVITTPFTFVATTHALHANRIRPVFVDIEPCHYTIDPQKVEAAITPFTTAILAVHVYGHPCMLDELADIARRHRLALVYDAAHAFGVRVRGRSIASFGDMTMFSFHATKLFHSIEGGMLAFADPRLKAEADYLKNFGIQDETTVVMPGTNAKMNEMQALMGELILPEVPGIIAARRAIYERYREHLNSVTGISPPPEPSADVEYNYSYVPVRVDSRHSAVSRDQLYERLKEYNVFARRYFYPLTCDFACYRGVPVGDPLHVARSVADTILALPIYPDLPLHTVDRICAIIARIVRGS